MARHGKLVAAVLVVQLAFWLVYVPAFIDPPVERPDFVVVESFATGRPATPDAAGLAATRFTETPPSRDWRAPGYYATRTTFSLEDVPAEGLALLDNSGGDNSRHFVNGALVHAPGRMDVANPTYHALREDIVQISPGLLKVGENRLESIYVVSSSREVGLLPSILGDYREISDAFGWKAFTLTQVPLIATVMVVVIALFAGLAALRARDPDVPLWLFFAAVGWASFGLFFEWAGFPIHGAARQFVYAAIMFGLAASWAIFADAWSKERVRYYRRAVLGLSGAGLVWSAYWLFADGGLTAFGKVEDAVEWIGFALSAATVLRIAWHFVAHPDEPRTMEAAALVLLASLMICHLYAIVTEGLLRPYLSTTQPLILLLLVGGFFARNFELFRSREQLNAELETQLVARTAELERAHTREKGLLRDRAQQEERRRIMRDMHDGMGSNLMSLLLAARRGKVDADTVARDIQMVIDEMRLMIDSMDSVGESLASALALFRERAQSRVTEAGFGFVWTDEAQGDLPELDPRQVLQVFRILQEAIANALKHSDGDRIHVVVRPTQLLVADNGSSFEGPRHGGRGLENMEARAGAIGGTFAIARSHGETIASIGLPEGPKPLD
ncbi:MAG: hypothetical protein CL808_03555 [Citromicrobium sp.]|nr:hypothetical protein [Citromicrobium sp.]